MSVFQNNNYYNIIMCEQSKSIARVQVGRDVLGIRIYKNIYFKSDISINDNFYIVLGM